MKSNIIASDNRRLSRGRPTMWHMYGDKSYPGLTTSSV